MDQPPIRQFILNAMLTVMLLVVVTITLLDMFVWDAVQAPVQPEPDDYQARCIATCGPTGVQSVNLLHCRCR